MDRLHLPIVVTTVVASVLLCLGLSKTENRLALSRAVRAVRLKTYRGPHFTVHTAHSLLKQRADGPQLLKQTEALIERLLKNAPDCGHSCDELPCSLVLLTTVPNGAVKVAGHVRLEKAKSFDLEKLRKMVKMGMVGPARQTAKVHGVPDDVIDQVVAGEEVVGLDGSGKAYLGSLVVEPEYQGLGLGKALARIGTAHTVIAGCSSVAGYAANEGLIPFYEKMGALAESSRPRVQRTDIPKVKVGSSRALVVDTSDFAGKVKSHMLNDLPRYVDIARVFE